MDHFIMFCFFYIQADTVHNKRRLTEQSAVIAFIAQTYLQ